MATESRWRTEARRVIAAALDSGRARGLDGFRLEQHVSEAYPFGARQNYPYKCWSVEFRRLVRGETVTAAGQPSRLGPRLVSDCPLFPGSLNRVHNAAVFEYDNHPARPVRVWACRLDLGDWLRVRYDRGRLTARTASTLTAARSAKAVFDERIAAPANPVPPFAEVAAILGHLYDFSGIDLDAVDAPVETAR